MLAEYKQKLKEYTHVVVDYVSRLSDVRIAGQVLFAIVVLLVSWSGVKAINANYSLEKQISGLQQQNDVQGLENSNTQLQNDYYNSNQYLELSGRQNFGLAAPGEKELLVPESVALSYTVSQPKPPAASVDAKVPFYQKNLQAWVNFFLHRKQAD
jgi:cell division protein FtsB